MAGGKPLFLDRRVELVLLLEASEKQLHFVWECFCWFLVSNNRGDHIKFSRRCVFCGHMSTTTSDSGQGSSPREKGQIPSVDFWYVARPKLPMNQNAGHRPPLSNVSFMSGAQ